MITQFIPGNVSYSGDFTWLDEVKFAENVAFCADCRSFTHLATTKKNHTIINLDQPTSRNLFAT
jgi:hypothetical protein